ncbi:hypothetical protein ACFE04_028664 [Oxalis oulophora]
MKRENENILDRNLKTSLRPSNTLRVKRQKNNKIQPEKGSSNTLRDQHLKKIKIEPEEGQFATERNSLCAIAYNYPHYLTFSMDVTYHASPQACRSRNAILIYDPSSDDPMTRDILRKQSGNGVTNFNEMSTLWNNSLIRDLFNDNPKEREMFDFSSAEARKWYKTLEDLID